MTLRRGNWLMEADYSAPVVEEKVEVKAEDKPKRGPGRPKKAVAPAEDSKGTTASDD